MRCGWFARNAARTHPQDEASVMSMKESGNATVSLVMSHHSWVRVSGGRLRHGTGTTCGSREPCSNEASNRAATVPRDVPSETVLYLAAAIGRFRLR